MTITINPSLAKVTNLCGGSLNNVSVAPRSVSCEFQFDTDKLHWDSPQQNKGTITLTRQDDPNSYCVYNYDYTYVLIPYSFFDIRSEVISLQSCHGNLKSNEISVNNAHNQALPRPLVGIMGFEVTQSIAIADCGGQGGDNCLVASPDINTVYKSNGSTLAQSLILQTKLDRYEALNFEQFIGSHNSAISHRYTTNTNKLNLSYSDPDHYMTLTDQLNSGVRQLELDIMWAQNRVRLCHTDKAIDPSGGLCEGNFPMSDAIAEIKTWVEKNPDALIFIYLDVHAPLTGHVGDLDTDLSPLASHVFTPKMASQYFHVENNTLPAFQLTQNQLLNQFKTNVIITNDDDRDTLKTSQYVFVNVQNSNAAPLTEIGVDTFFASGYASCVDQSKYNNIKSVFNNDPNHYNLLRFNSGRTTLNYVTSVKNKTPDQYVNYFTTQNLSNMLNCPVNIFSTSLLGFTCDTNSCNAHPSDPQLYTFLWSWSLGYPLQSGGSQLAYINPNTNHFENDPLIQGNTYAVLCYQKSAKQITPIAPLQWYLNNVKIDNAATAFKTAYDSCQNTGGIFAVPTMSYWMHDVISIIKAKNLNVLVNYKNDNGQWIPNSGYVNENHQTLLKGRSLVKP